MIRKSTRARNKQQQRMLAQPPAGQAGVFPHLEHGLDEPIISSRSITGGKTPKSVSSESSGSEGRESRHSLRAGLSSLNSNTGESRPFGCSGGPSPPLMWSNFWKQPSPLSGRILGISASQCGEHRES